MFISSEVSELVKEIADILVKSGESVAVSESCCGGLIASCLVSVPGASRYFVGGTTTYSLNSRLKLSGWSQDDIDSYTGPSQEVAVRLARNLKMELSATYTLAETGWAGPDDGLKGGNAFLTVSCRNKIHSREIKTELNDRIQNMETFAAEALKFLLEVIRESQQK